MQIGDKIISEKNKEYIITKGIATGDRPNANVYLCEDLSGKKFVAKHFYNQRPMPYLAYATKNHYGRRRDGSWRIFNEIKEAGKKFDFIVKHIDRIKHKGKWVIIIEHIDGETLSQFINKNKSNIALLSNAIVALAETLSDWHSNGFAHGDPHFDNCLIRSNKEGDLKVYLIDYSQIHHSEFHYCKQFHCYKPDFDKRIQEDLINPAINFGRGFKHEVIQLSSTIGISNDLVNLFEANYKI